MVFSSYSFLLVFLPIVLILYFGMAKYVSRAVQHTFLIFASLVFYAQADISYVWIIIASVVVNFVAAKITSQLPDGKKRKTVFTLAVLFNVGLLGYYKYYMFFLENINMIFDTHFTLKYIILPIGISFFTFQQIAYQISIWQRKETVPRFVDYALFITYFPQLVAGPIVFSEDVMTQYQDDKNRFFNINNFAKGAYIFCMGLFKKAVLADSMALIVDNGYGSELHNLSFGGAWIVALCYSMQIYFDFCGYSDMAMGLGKMMNIDFPVNFYSPFKSKSVGEFWKRWHITLGRSLAILIYYPLGGNRKGYSRTCLNLFLVFFVSGIWHGAAWTFIIWGSLHGVIRVLEKIFEKQMFKIPGAIRVFYTYMFLVLTWVIFRSKTLTGSWEFLKKMLVPDSFSFSGIGRLATDGVLTYPESVQAIYIIVFLVILIGISMFAPKNSIDLFNNFKPKTKYAVASAILLSISIVHMSKAGAFIYFNF